MCFPGNGCCSCLCDGRGYFPCQVLHIPGGPDCEIGFHQRQFRIARTKVRQFALVGLYLVVRTSRRTEGARRTISSTAWSLVVQSSCTLQVSKVGQTKVPLDDENVGTSKATLQLEADTKSSRRRPEATVRSAPQAGDLAFASIPTITGVFPNASWVV